MSHKCQTNQKKQSKIIVKLYGVVRHLRPIKWNITNLMLLNTLFVWRSRNGNELECWCFMIKGKLAHEIRLGQPCDLKMWDGLRRVSSTVKPDVGFYTLTLGWLEELQRKFSECSLTRISLSQGFTDCLQFTRGELTVWDLERLDCTGHIYQQVPSQNGPWPLELCVFAKYNRLPYSKGLHWCELP